MTDNNNIDDRLLLGWLRDFQNVKVQLLCEGLKAHTAIIAQSGSGKSFTLGRFIEEIAIFTKARIFIIDPNADFVHLHETNDESWENDNIKPWLGGQSKQDFEGKWEKVYINVITNRPEKDFKSRTNHKVFNIKFDWLNLRIDQQLEILGLNTIEFPGLSMAIDEVNNKFKSENNQKEPIKAYEDALRDQIISIESEEDLKILRESLMKAMIVCLDRINLEISGKKIWSGNFEDSLFSKIKEGYDKTGSITVIDLPSLDEKKDEMMAANFALNCLWDLGRKSWAEGLKDKKKNKERTPTFIVIDEAHNLAPADSYNIKNVIERNVNEIISKIATEGRKYGLFLIVVTQRPTRINPTIIAQCDNLCLQRIHNRNDLQLIQRAFGILPEGWANQATDFSIGDAILCGEFVKSPAICHIAARRCAEGGANLGNEWCNKE